MEPLPAESYITPLISLDYEFELDFICDGVNYSRFGFGMAYNPQIIYLGASVVYANGWKAEKYKIITINSDEVSVALSYGGVTAETFIAWLNANATKQVNTITPTFTNNSSTNGGVVYAAGGTVNISGGTFTSNSATGNGGVVAISAGELTVADGSFSTNSALLGGVVSVVDNNSVAVTIQNGTFEQNSASIGGVLATNADSVSATITINDGTYTNNSATGTAISFEILNGTLLAGGVFGFIAASTNSVTIAGGTYTNNSAFGDADAVLGGAIASLAQLNIAGGTYTGNSAFGSGDAIFAAGTLSLSNATFSNHTMEAVEAESAIVEDCTFTNNGVALRLTGDDGNVVSNCVFDGNTHGLGADNEDTTVNNCTFVNNEKGISADSTGIIEVNGGTFENNTKDGIWTNWGSIVVNGATFKNNCADGGAAIDSDGGGSVTLTNTTFENNIGPDETLKDVYLGYSDLAGSSYITLGSELSGPLYVYKNGITDFADGDAPSSYIAYSTTPDYLQSALENITVVNMPEDGELSILAKPNYVVIGDNFGLFDINTGNQIYSWKKLKNLGYVTVEDDTVSAFNKTLEGRLLVRNNISTIGTGVFVDSLISELYLPDSVTTIQDDAFTTTGGLSSSLTTLKIGSGISSVGRMVFESQLTSLYLSDLKAWCEADKYNDIILLANNLYINNRAVTDLVISEDTTKIVGQAFRGLNAVTSVSIPASVTQIDDFAFGEMKNNTTFTVNSANANFAVVENVLFNKDISKLVSYPTGKTGNYTIAETVNTIAAGAFAGCAGLTGDLVIPATCTSIGYMAFANCAALESVTFAGDIATVKAGTFAGCSSVALAEDRTGQVCDFYLRRGYQHSSVRREWCVGLYV